MDNPRAHTLLVLTMASLAVCPAAFAAPVGLLESIDLEVLQGGQTLFQFGNISTTGNLNGQDILLGTVDQTNVWLRVMADQPNSPLVEDRLLQFAIRGTTAGADAANLFKPDDDGEIEVRLTGMKFDNVDGISGNRVEPFQPGQYLPYPLSELPLFYFLDGLRGFVNLTGSEKYSPAEPSPYDLGGWARPSVQVPMRYWADPYSGYGFSQVDVGHLTGFSLSGIPDFGGTGSAHTGALPLTPVLDPPIPPYFGTTFVPSAAEAGFVSEIGITLNMRGYVVPEPATIVTIVFLGLGVLVGRGGRRQKRPSAGV